MSTIKVITSVQRRRRWSAEEKRAIVGKVIDIYTYYSPESNGMAETFIKTFKRDYVRIHELPDAVTVMEQLPRWFEDYNENHPHKGLKMMSPREYIKLMNRVDECSVQ